MEIAQGNIQERNGKKTFLDMLLTLEGLTDRDIQDEVDTFMFEGGICCLISNFQERISFYKKIMLLKKKTPEESILWFTYQRNLFLNHNSFVSLMITIFKVKNAKIYMIRVSQVTTQLLLVPAGSFGASLAIPTSKRRSTRRSTRFLVNQ